MQEGGKTPFSCNGVREEIYENENNVMDGRMSDDNMEMLVGVGDKGVTDLVHMPHEREGETVKDNSIKKWTRVMRKWRSHNSNDDVMMLPTILQKRSSAVVRWMVRGVKV